MKKKVFSLFLAALMLLSLTACGGAEKPEEESKEGTYVVGICQLAPHPALDAATQGFIDTLEKELPGQVECKVQNAANDSPTCVTIINGFVSAGVDLIMANATPSLQAAAAGAGDIPVLGTAVTEYGVALGIDDFDGLVGTNVSGTSDLAPLDQQADLLTEWCPEAKTVGLLYCSGEPNSRYQVDEMQKLLEAKGLQCTQFSFSDTNDLASVTQMAADSSDVLYVPTDNTAASNAGIIDNICRPAGVPVIVGEENLCAGCGLATLSISYYDLGAATAKMAVRILTGESKVEEMPVEYVTDVTPKYNAAICEALGMTPLDGYEAVAAN